MDWIEEECYAEVTSFLFLTRLSRLAYLDSLTPDLTISTPDSPDYLDSRLPDSLISIYDSLCRFAISRLAISRLAISRLAISRFAISRFAISRFAISRFAISKFAISQLSYLLSSPTSVSMYHGR